MTINLKDPWDTLFDEAESNNPNKLTEQPQNNEIDTKAVDPWNDLFDKASSLQVGVDQQPQEETFLQSLTRHGARTASRIVETIAGIPGDVLGLVKTGAEYLNEKFPASEQDIKGIDPTLGSSEKFYGELLKKVPTSEDLKNISIDLTNKYTEAKGSGEEFWDEGVSLATAVMLGSELKNIGKIAGKAFASKGAGKGVEAIGGGEGAQTGTEVGTLLAFSVFNPKAFKAHLNKLYKDAEKALPKNTMIQSQGLVDGLDALEKDLSKGVGTKTKEEVLRKTRELRTKASGGALPMEDLTETIRDVNEVMSSKDLFDNLSKGEKATLKNRYDKFKNVVNKEIDDYGKYNPDFVKKYRDANQAFRVDKDSRRALNFVKEWKHSIPVGLHAVLAGTYLNPAFAFKAAPLAGAAYGAIKGGEFIYKIMNSPVLRKYYAESMKMAVDGNKTGFINSLNKIDKGLKKEQD